MNGIQIVEETGAVDFRSLLPLLRAEWPEGFGSKSDDDLMSLMEQDYRPGVDIIHSLYVSGGLAGFSRYIPWPREDPRPTAVHTLDIAVAEGNRGRGLGKLLIRNMMKDCRVRGYARMLSRSFRSNPASMALHNSLGFSVYLETDDSVVWEMSFLDE